MKLFFVVVTLIYVNGSEEDRLVMASMDVVSNDQCTNKALELSVEAAAQLNEVYPLNPIATVAVQCFDATAVNHMEIE